jgi:hypothetical protein
MSIANPLWGAPRIHGELPWQNGYAESAAVRGEADIKRA